MTKQLATEAQKTKVIEIGNKINEATDSYTKEKVTIPTINKHGTIVSDKETYQGGVTDANTPFGCGTLEIQNTGVFVGSFTHGKMEFGQLTYQDKRVYQGFFKDGKPNGWGVLISSDGKTEYYSDSFEGDKYGDSLDTKLQEPITLLNNLNSDDDSTALSIYINQALTLFKNLIGMLYGNDIYLVYEIKYHIKKDVEDVVARAKEETTKAQLIENIYDYFQKQGTNSKSNNVKLLVADNTESTDGKNYIIVHNKSNNSKEKGQLKYGRNILEIKQSSIISKIYNRPFIESHETSGAPCGPLGRHRAERVFVSNHVEKKFLQGFFRIFSQ